jgi:hypothetical protein
MVTPTPLIAQTSQTATSGSPRPGAVPRWATVPDPSLLALGVCMDPPARTATPLLGFPRRCSVLTVPRSLRTSSHHSEHPKKAAHLAVGRRVTGWRGSALARRVPLRGGRNARMRVLGTIRPDPGSRWSPRSRQSAAWPSQLAGVGGEEVRP